eukprot:11184931-Lingulodinium_polyedra.AAC.1
MQPQPQPDINILIANVTVIVPRLTPSARQSLGWAANASNINITANTAANIVTNNTTRTITNMITIAPVHCP